MIGRAVVVAQDSGLLGIRGRLEAIGRGPGRHPGAVVPYWDGRPHCDCIEPWDGREEDIREPSSPVERSAVLCLR